MYASVLFVTSHFFAPGYRKTDIHFLAQEFRSRGTSVRVLTVGQSRLRTWVRPTIRPFIARTGRNRWVLDSTGVASAVMDELVHPFSSRSSVAERLSTPLFWAYGKSLPVPLLDIEAPELVIIESGYPLAYFSVLKRRFPTAKFVCFVNDILGAVGFRKQILTLECNALPLFDLVRVPASEIAIGFPEGTRWVEIPHGIDGARFDACRVSPYPSNSKHLVSVGDMLLDSNALLTMAASAPQATFHIIGAQPAGLLPPNIVVHGEMDFDTTIAYIKFADVGIAAYRVSPSGSYLANSSLKMRLYSYCGLPVLAPDSIDWRRANVITYDRHVPSSVTAAVAKALQYSRFIPDRHVGWSTILDRLVDSIWAPPTDPSP